MLKKNFVCDIDFGELHMICKSEVDDVMAPLPVSLLEESTYLTAQTRQNAACFAEKLV